MKSLTSFQKIKIAIALAGLLFTFVHIYLNKQDRMRCMEQLKNCDQLVSYEYDAGFLGCGTCKLECE